MFRTNDGVGERRPWPNRQRAALQRRCAVSNPTISLRVVGVLGLAAASVLAGCGDEQDTAPTAEQLAAHLVTVDSFDGDWTINAGPDDGTDMTSGVIPGDQRDMLPTIELCEAASPEAQDAAESLTWTAFRQLDLTEDDPIDPPNDRTGHMVFVQQFLTSGDHDQLATTFELLRSGSEACLGPIAAGEEGPGQAEAMPIPEAGDARFGVRTTIEEAGGWAEWRLYNAFVLDNEVMMSFLVADIRAGDGVEPYYSTDDIDDMIVIAADTM
jgi:hypothetical protein